MNSASDPALAAFATEFLEIHGGLIERQGERLLALLPSSLSERLQLPEETCLGTEQAPLIYGSPVVDRLIKLATEEIPIVHAHGEIPYLKKDGFEQAISKDLELMAGQFELTGRAETLASYMVLVCHYVALSDERKEGLVRVAVNENSGAHVPGFEDLWTGFHICFYERESAPEQFSAVPERALETALESARAIAEHELSDFLDAMRRRLRRDAKNTREYYEALTAEMEAGLFHPNLTEIQRDERKAKIADLPKEMSSKINDLKLKYSVRVSISARAALRLLVPVVQLMVRLRYRKHLHGLSMIWNPLTRRIDPLVCRSCGCTTALIFPSESKTGLRLVCRACSDAR